MLLTNGSVYTRLPSGRVIEAPRGLPNLRLSAGDYARNRFYYMAAGAWTLIFLVLALRTWQKTNNIKQELQKMRYEDES